MIPRDIIHRNMTFSDAPRIGMFFDRNRMTDMLCIPIGPSTSWHKRIWVEGKFEYYDDAWGNVWHRMCGMSAGGEIFKPALECWEDINNYCLPDFDEEQRYADAKKVCSSTNLYRVGVLPGFPFSICRYLRKMEIYLQDLLLEREWVDRLHEMIVLLLKRIIRRFAEAGVDAIVFFEDWGIQDRLIISPSMWREIYKPLYKDLCSEAHQHKLMVLMHSCGNLTDILDDLAEVGINSFQFDQPRLYGLDVLAAKCRQMKVCLWSPVDIQSVLPSGNRETIERNVEEMVRLFGRNNGGMIARGYEDLHGIGVDPQWDQWAYEKFRDIMWH